MIFLDALVKKSFFQTKQKYLQYNTILSFFTKKQNSGVGPLLISLDPPPPLSGPGPTFLYFF